MKKKYYFCPMKKCANCNKETLNGTKHCSLACFRIFKNKQYLRKKKAKNTTPEKHCGYCGKIFEYNRIDKTTCSKECQQKFFYFKYRLARTYLAIQKEKNK